MICAALASLWLTAGVSASTDYTKGVFIVNEDWYGHQNSTVNYLLPDESDGECWHYRVVQEENPGQELGCTAQFGAIWKGRFYIISKQAKDPGASVEGGRITVCDAKTMKILHQSVLIDPSGRQCDGRGFIGVDEHKGYISTSNGVWILDLDTYEVKGRIEGTDNPDAGEDTTPGGSLYHGQCGSMVEAEGRIFVAHQSEGLLVVDPVTDKVVDKVSMSIVGEKAGIGSVVKSKDGSLWLSASPDVSGAGNTLPCVIRVNPATLETKVIDMAEGIFPPANSWYAWTPDAFCASDKKNTLYWKGGASRWFSGTTIYRYDIDTGDQTKLIDLEAEGENWKLYGCSMRVHPATGDIYMSLYHEFSIPTYVTRRYSSDGKMLREYPMIQNFWFPSLPVFPEEAYGSAVDEVESVQPRLRLDGNRVTNCGDDEMEVRVFRLDGIEALRVALCPGESLPLDGLAAGIYVAVSGNDRIKFSYIKN